MTITELQNIIRNNEIKLISHPRYSISSLIEEKIQDCKIYESDNYFIRDIILQPNEITGYMDIVNEVVVIANYFDQFKDKEIYKFTIHHYIQFLYKGGICIDNIRLSCKELCRRELQDTKFVKLDSAKNTQVEFNFSLSSLSYDDLLIPDFDPSSIYPIYKRLISEKYKLIIPSIKKLKEGISDNKILFDVFSEEFPIKNHHDFSPFDYEEIKDDLDEEIINNHFKLHECENKLYMINDWLRKIHYTYLSNKENAIKCKQFLIDSVKNHLTKNN